MVRDDRRCVVDVLDEIGLDTRSAQRRQNAPGNAQIFVLIVELGAVASAHSRSIVPPGPCPPLVRPGHTWARSVIRDALVNKGLNCCATSRTFRCPERQM